MSVSQELVRFGRELIGRRALEPTEIQRYEPTFQSYVDAYLQFQGQIYQPAYTTTYAGQKVEPVTDSFRGFVDGAYKANGIIFAVSMARARPFSEISFKFRRRNQVGGGNDLFGNRDLEILETPWPGGTTQSLLMRAEQDVTAGGTAFWAREDGPNGDRLRRLRPDWCEFILTAPPDEAVQSDVVGIKYTPGGPWSDNTPQLYLVGGEFAEATYWAPIPDPDALFRGMSWLSPVIEEMQSDKAATVHKRKFFENAATPNLAVSLKETVSPEAFAKFVRTMNEASVGVEQAYKTLYTGGGADVRVVGADMKQIDFRGTQGAGETRIAAAGGVPPIVVGLSEGLAAATYSNYGQARRAFADGFLRSQWRSLCGALAPLVDVPPDAQLWYDSRDVAFLREDVKDLAEVLATNAGTINTLISAGYTPESAVAAVLAEDFSLLVHTGMVSVQLQPPGAGQPGESEPEPEATPEEVFSIKVKDVQTLAGPAAFEPDSVVLAIEAQDLSKLVEAEPEPVEVVAPAAKPGATAVRYSMGMADVDDLIRHGTHNQKSHGNRLGRPENVGGTTGLAKATAALEDKPVQGPERDPRRGTSDVRYGDKVTLVRRPDASRPPAHVGRTGRVADVDVNRVTVEFSDGKEPKVAEVWKPDLIVDQTVDELDASDRDEMDAESDRLQAETRKLRDAEKAAEVAKPEPRTFSTVEIRDILMPDAKDKPHAWTSSASRKTEDHVQMLMDAGVPRDQANQIINDLGGDSSKPWQTYDPAYTLNWRVEREAAEAKEAEFQARLALATPAAYAQLLGTDGTDPLVKSKPVRAVFEAMQASGWTMTGATGHGGYTFSSPDGSRKIQVLAVNGVNIYDERHNKISGVKALAYVNGSPA
jgi:hypothetical protein